jgi:hypothetical protein
MNATADSDSDRELLGALTPDSVGPLALSCLLAARGPNPVVRKQGAHAVNQFQRLVSSYPPNTPEGLFLGRLERVAYAAAATMIEADREAEDTIAQAQHDYENALLGSSVKSQVYLGIVKWLVRVLLFMGAGFFLARLGLDLAASELSDTERVRAQWLPFVAAFAIPVLIGVGQSLWRVYTAVNLVYQRDLRIAAARRSRRSKQKAAIRYAKEHARLAWEDFVGPGQPVPADRPTLDLLHALYLEEIRVQVAPPLNIILLKALKRQWNRLRLWLRRH